MASSLTAERKGKPQKVAKIQNQGRHEKSLALADLEGEPQENHTPGIRRDRSTGQQSRGRMTWLQQ